MDADTALALAILALWVPLYAGGRRAILRYEARVCREHARYIAEQARVVLETLRPWRTWAGPVELPEPVEPSIPRTAAPEQNEHAALGRRHVVTR